MTAGVNARSRSSTSQRDAIRCFHVAARDPNLPVVVSPPTLDCASIGQTACVLMTKGQSDHVRTEVVGSRGDIFALVPACSASGRTNLVVSNLTVAVSAPTKDIAVVVNRTRVPFARHQPFIDRFERVVIPLPGDVGADRGISSDVGTINAWRQGPIHVERECC